MKKENKNFIKEFIINTLKGIYIGIANIISGVSGETHAIITGIIERLIKTIKFFNLKELQLLLKFKIKDLIKYIDFYFLLAFCIGVIIAILSVAKLFSFSIKNYPFYIWIFFFDLIGPFTLGCAIVIAFANVFLLIIKKFHNKTIDSLTGFIVGFLNFILPWEKPIFTLASSGNILIEKVEHKILKYQNFVPYKFSNEVFRAIICAITGISVIYITEKVVEK